MLTLSARLFGVLLALASLLRFTPDEPGRHAHPDWCDPAECSSRSGSPVHRSAFREIDRQDNEIHEVQSQLTRAEVGNGVTSVIVDALSEETEPMPAGFYEQTLILSLRQADVLARHLADLVALAGGPNDPARTADGGAR